MERRLFVHKAIVRFQGSDCSCAIFVEADLARDWEKPMSTASLITRVQKMRQSTQMLSLSTQWGGSRRQSDVDNPNQTFARFQIPFETKQKPESEGDAGHFDESRLEWRTHHDPFVL